MFCSSRVSDSCVVLWSAYRPTGTHPTRGPHDREVPVSCRRLCATRKTNYLLEYYSSLDVVPHRVFARPTRPGTTTHPSSPSIHSVRCRTPSSASFHSLCDVPSDSVRPGSATADTAVASVHLPRISLVLRSPSAFFVCRWYGHLVDCVISRVVMWQRVKLLNMHTSLRTIHSTLRVF